MVIRDEIELIKREIVRENSLEVTESEIMIDNLLTIENVENGMIYSAPGVTQKIGVPQGLVLGPLPFNIFINDVFYLVNDNEICNYADDTTLYTCYEKRSTVLSKLEKDTLLVSEWFSNNFMKLTKEKCHLLIHNRYRRFRNI